MQLCPCLNQPVLPPRKFASDQFNSINGIHTYSLLVVRVKMRSVMGAGRLGVHSYDDAKESANLRHSNPLAICG
jgi:hypothetical protein